MILFSLWQFTDIPPLKVETLSLCGLPTLLVATPRIGCIVTQFAAGQPAQVLSSPPQDGPHAQRK